MSAPKPVVVWISDLFFRARIESTARALGIPLFCGPGGALPPDGAFAGCLIDLESAGEGAFARLPEVAAAHHTVGFASHVRTELFERAAAAGCGEVLPRSRFVGELPALLRRLQGPEP
jgi:hypothetical protein